MVCPITLVQARHLILGYVARVRQDGAIPTYDTEDLKSTLQRFGRVLGETRRRQRYTAEQLDMLDALGLASSLKEDHHSRFLAYLLSPNEDHAQNNLFFRIFLRQTGLPAWWADVEFDAVVQKQGEESRIDIEVASKEDGSRGFVVHIENKVTASPGVRQIEREGADMERCAIRKRLPAGHAQGFLLMPHATTPAHRWFRWIGWSTIEMCLTEFIRRASANRAKFAAEQYLLCMRKHVPGIKPVVEDEDEAAD